MGVKKIEEEVSVIVEKLIHRISKPYKKGAEVGRWVCVCTRMLSQLHYVATQVVVSGT